ncbi:MAG: hypothetical protein U0670_08695 [Anaerolineae bacterium]
MNADGRVTTYSYNSVDELTNVNLNGASVTYTYDLRGNRTGMTDGGATNVTYAYDALDRLTQVNGGATTATFSYDADGRRVNSSINGVIRQYVWDEGSTYGDVLLELDGNGTPVSLAIHWLEIVSFHRLTAVAISYRMRWATPVL